MKIKQKKRESEKGNLAVCYFFFNWGIIKYPCCKWSLKNQKAEAVNVCITNEHSTSQTCFFCSDGFIRLRQQKKGKSYTKGTILYWTNPSCILVIKKHATRSRNSLSALVGLSTVLPGSPLPLG